MVPTSSFRFRFVPYWTLSAGLLLTYACSSDPEFEGGDGDGDGDGDGTGSVSGDGDGTGSVSGDGDLSLGGEGNQSGDGDLMGGAGGGGPVCETASSDAELAPIFLAVAFDVSGSMGHYDHPYWWHDPEAKWLPVVEATTAFFEDSTSEGISASMALFPFAGEKEERCSAETYASPDVPMMALPSSAFADVFDAYEEEVGSPLAGGDWRGGTPTLAAFQGTRAYLEAQMDANPDAKFALVLVTDGLPQGCDGEVDVPQVAAAAEDLYGAGSGLPTYVIGIENPTIPPEELPAHWDDWGCGPDDDEPCASLDTLDDLNQVAEAGGTESAFLIDTNDPTLTKQKFRAAIDAIRSKAISCELGIPDPPTPDLTFDQDKINVSVTVDSVTTTLIYDPECKESGSWRYDDPDEAEFIELCEETCAEIQNEPGAQLSVDFLCEPRPDVIR